MTAALLILAAVEGELGGLPGELRETRAEIAGGRPIRSIRAGILHDIPVRLVVSGPGMANAVHAAAVAVQRERPRGILAIGCAGAFVAAGLDIGDVPAPLPFSVLPGERPIAADPPGRYPCDAPWTRAAADALTRAWSARTVRVGVGPILTVSTVTTTDERAAALFRELRPVMEAMEGAGAAHVAALHGLPFLEIRAAANRVGHRDREAWDLPLAFRRCGEAVRAVLRAGAVPE